MGCVCSLWRREGKSQLLYLTLQREGSERMEQVSAQRDTTKGQETTGASCCEGSFFSIKKKIISVAEWFTPEWLWISIPGDTQNWIRTDAEQPFPALKGNSVSL